MAGAWLHSTVSLSQESSHALMPGDYCLATHLRLGCEMSIRHAPSTHEYGKVIDGNGYFLMTCKTGGDPVWTPERLSNTWSGCLQEHSPDTVTATAMIGQILWLFTLTLVVTLN